MRLKSQRARGSESTQSEVREADYPVVKSEEHVEEEQQLNHGVIGVDVSEGG